LFVRGNVLMASPSTSAAESSPEPPLLRPTRCRCPC
jgi:hypothetical protein